MVLVVVGGALVPVAVADVPISSSIDVLGGNDIVVIDVTYTVGVSSGP